MAWPVFQNTSRFFARTARSKRGDVAEESSSLREMMLSVRVAMIYKRGQKVYGSKPGCSFSTPLIIGCIYRPPSTATADINKFTACLEDAFDKIDKCNHNINRPNIALVGDFNATSPKWCASDKYNCAGRLIEESVLRLGLHQLVDFPTHLHSDGNLGSFLDVLLVSCDRLVSEITSLPPGVTRWPIWPHTSHLQSKC